MSEDPFWSGKRVLVTGHTGFKGGWLSLWLQELGSRVTGFSLPAPPTEPNLFTVANVGASMHSIPGDIRDAAALRDAVAQARPEIVFHLAAQPLVRRSYAEPVETYSTNVLGTVQVLDALRAAPGLRAIVVVTTDKCYENNDRPQAFREDDRLGGHDPYSSSKACAELVAQSFRDSYFPVSRHAEHGVGLATARAGNVIGGGDWADDRLIPDALRAVDRGVTLSLRNPRATRPWQHVLEPVCGYLTLAKALWEHGPSKAQAWNFGPFAEDARDVGWIVREFQTQSGLPLSWNVAEGPHPHEAQWLELDWSKAERELGWRPRWRVHHALHQTATWHQAHAAGQQMRAFTVAQIREYAASSLIAP
ncbi:CDP-glucose 4,6-dehydratase [Panacagrimonas perspica]|uniref:CDP-glucose 4,6-dehydratase n=1 Tax=Panacagrimonas perspica TaxID=381431 RepID=A0A4S3K0B4_9GAMM|nr:CDP-glucose 4,6-dehydratase [Panacagrimonas perspica]TDU28342.1 CDP-glucose 4,6-dehydratase [Panacagrimonas perspica]THD01238.1 CDP-glucose 4,6-dehydratase [Panacagrimonas perspica]